MEIFCKLGKTSRIIIGFNEVAKQMEEGYLFI